MSTPEQPLTRRQLRERSMTGPVTVPIANFDADARFDADGRAADAVDEAPVQDAQVDTPLVDAPVDETPDVEAPVGEVPLVETAVSDAWVEADSTSGAAENVDASVQPPDEAVTPAPVFASDDSFSRRLTRRQLREQEKIRTASVPVIAPPAGEPQIEAGAERVDLERVSVDETSPAEDEPPVDDVPAVAEAPSAPESSAEYAVLWAPEPVASAPSIVREAAPVSEWASEVVEARDDSESEDSTEPVVDPAFGASLLAAESRVAAAPLPPSFDEIVARGVTTSTSSTPSALILSQTPEFSLSGPLTGSGEMIVTGTLHLPEGLGSTGGDPLTADGKEADAVLFDRELPPASSPTPIAASAAISTVRGATDIIQPPAPEKGSRLVLTLAITAAVLAVAVIGAVILAVTTGVFG